MTSDNLINRSVASQCGVRLLILRALAFTSVTFTAVAWAEEANRTNLSGDSGRRLISDAPEVLIGDRLFFETRFAHYFYANAQGSVNSSLRVGDPVVHEVERPRLTSLSGPFDGQGISCRHCHLGDDFLTSARLAQRTYADFSERSAIPTRNDGLTHTVRNTSQMVDLGLPRQVPRLFHFDGEFASAEDLVIDTLTGRNMGWLASERAIGVAHIAKVIRNDNGVNPRHVRMSDGRGIPYRVVLRGAAPSIPDHLRIPPRYRLDVEVASDFDVLRGIARLIHAYMDSIRFGTEDTNRRTGSPYDLFLERTVCHPDPWMASRTFSTPDGCLSY